MATKTPKQSPPNPKPARLAKPKHGNGLLRRGGNPGNRGGGRPKSAVRESMRHALDTRIGMLCEIADSPDTAVGERIKALDLLARYGLGTQQEVEQQGEVRHAVVVLPALD